MDGNQVSAGRFGGLGGSYIFNRFDFRNDTDVLGMDVAIENAQKTVTRMTANQIFIHQL